ncbi:phosphomannomutase/phosphoglucomutase [Microbulbifer agarilyticus]|nr:phosphomannomutase/phosphoglucomutase [Microbulbifer agarilyticus]
MRTPSTEIPAHVFRAYDIRGIAGEEINEPFAYQLGRALGTIALQAGQQLLLVGRDGRNSSELLRDCLIEGILESGCNAVDLGLVPSPVLYFACSKGKNANSGVMVTASHNPAEYNGFKIVMDGRSLADDKLQDLRALMLSGQFASGESSNSQQDIRDTYIDEIFNDVALAGQPHVVIDAGNGATSELAPELFEQLGCAVDTLYCEVDGNFPNHAPDPSRPENLQDLITAVKGEGADLGIALDGDGDRVTLVTSSGRIVWADQLVMLLARDILARNPGSDVVFDVKSSRALADLVTQYGGRPVMWKTGHAPMKAKMLETGALLGGELSGHIFIKDRWYGFDDGIYAAARILEIMALREQTLDELLDSLPKMVNTPEILLPVAEADKFALIERLRNEGTFGQADLNTIDGLRIEFADGWGLVRASNTTAALTLRFEADDEAALARIRELVGQQLQKIDPALVLP